MARRRFPVVSTSVVAFAGIDEWHEPQRAEPVMKTPATPVPVTLSRLRRPSQRIEAVIPCLR